MTGSRRVLLLTTLCCSLAAAAGAGETAASTQASDAPMVERHDPVLVPAPSDG